MCGVIDRDDTVDRVKGKGFIPEEFDETISDVSTLLRDLTQPGM